MLPLTSGLSVRTPLPFLQAFTLFLRTLNYQRVILLLH